jgi:uncharacterized membrane protein YhiD involved in acid resistance
MTEHYIEIAVRLLIALAAGGFIGLKRSYHGRPAFARMRWCAWRQVC